MMRNGYLVLAGSPIRQSADVDRTGVTVGAVKGQSQQIFVSQELKNAVVRVFPTMPANDALLNMLTSGELDAFAANRQRMAEAAAVSPKLKVLDDDFLLIGQAIVVAKGDAAGLAAVNQFVAEVRASGFVTASIERAALSSVVRTPR
jgi:polar amino acid transport system substrate-binding protein